MFVDRFLASSFVDGSISSLNYASRITAIFDSMILMGVGVIVLPILSQLNIEGNNEKITTTTTFIFKWFFIVFLPIAVGSMIFSREIIEIVYMRGEFGADNVLVVSNLFFYYAPLILLLPLQFIVIRFFHSLENTKTPLYCTSFSVILNIVLSIFLSRIYGLHGLVISVSTAVLTNVLLLLFLMQKNIGWDRVVFGIKDALRVLVITAALIQFLLYVKSLDVGKLGMMSFAFLGGILYIVLTLALMKRDRIYFTGLFKK